MGFEVNVGQELPSIIGGIIRDRFDKQQFEMFMQNEYASYQSELNNLSAALANPSDPDMASKIHQSYSAATNKMLISATRYAKNPYISQLSKSHFDHDMKQFDGLLKLAEITAGGGGKGQAEIELAQQRTQTSKSLGLKYEAETKALGAKPGRVTNFFDNWDTSSIASMTGALGRFDSPSLVKRRDEEKGQIRASLASQQIAELARTNTINPATDRPYGTGGENEVKQVLMSGTIPPEKVNEAWEMKTLVSELTQKGWSPEQVERTFPQYDWPSKAQTSEVIARGNLTPEQAGRVLLGDTEIKNLTGVGGGIKHAKDIVDRLPNDMDTLAPGPIKEIFNAIRNEKGNPNTQEPFTNYKEYDQWLRNKVGEHVNSMIGGENIPDNMLDDETRSSRQRARSLGNLITSKYGPHLARALQIPGAPKKPDTGYFPGLIPESLKKVVGETVGGLFGEKVFEPAAITPTQQGVKGPVLPEGKKAPARPTPALLNLKVVKVMDLDRLKQNKYYSAQSQWMGSEMATAEWEPVGPNSDGDMIIRNTRTGKSTIVTWEGKPGEFTGLKPKKKK